MRRALTVLVALSLPSVAGAGELVDDGPPLGRVSYLEGKLRVRGAFDEEQIFITTNAVIPPGDELSSPSGSFVEIEVQGGSFVRLAGGTTIILDRVDGLLLVILSSGAVSASRGARADPISVVALGSRVALDAPAHVRVSLDRRQMRAETRVIRGRAEIFAGSSSETLHAGQMLTRVPGSTQHSTWDRQQDAFDNWVARRDEWYASRSAPRELAGGDYLGLYDLAGEGEWIMLNNQQAWRPHVAAGWRPYLRGRWSWTGPYGWVWVPRARWGYVTHHYGRWTFTEAHGWVWIPDSVWGPAWVAWAAVGPYVGWAPLGPTGHAVYVTEITHPYDPLAWIFADLFYFYHGGGGCCCDKEEPFETLDHDVIVSMSGRVVDNPSEELAPPGPSGRLPATATRGRLFRAITKDRPIPKRSKQAAHRRRLNKPRQTRRLAYQAPVEAIATLGRSPYDALKGQRKSPVTKPVARPSRRKSLSVTIGSRARYGRPAARVRSRQEVEARSRMVPARPASPPAAASRLSHAPSSSRAAGTSNAPAGPGGQPVQAAPQAPAPARSYSSAQQVSPNFAAPEQSMPSTQPPWQPSKALPQRSTPSYSRPSTPRSSRSTPSYSRPSTPRSSRSTPSYSRPSTPRSSRLTPRYSPPTTPRSSRSTPRYAPPSTPRSSRSTPSRSSPSRNHSSPPASSSSSKSSSSKRSSSSSKSSSAKRSSSRSKPSSAKRSSRGSARRR